MESSVNKRKKCGKKSFDYYEEYFNFDIGNIEFNQLILPINYYNIESEQNALKKAKEIYNNFLLLLTERLNQMTYPYLKTCFDCLEVQNYPENVQKYLLLFIIGNNKEILAKLTKFFTLLIKSNNFGITNKANNLIDNNKAILSSKEYISFINDLSTWYSNIEILLLNFYLLSLYYNMNFDFKENKFSYETNFDYENMKLFTKKTGLKLAAEFVRKFTFGYNLDFQKIGFGFLAMMATGFSWTNFFVILPAKKILTAVSAGILNIFVLTPIGNKIDDHSSSLPFNTLAKTLKDLDCKLQNIMEYLFKLYKLKFENDEIFNFEKYKIQNDKGDEHEGDEDDSHVKNRRFEESEKIIKEISTKIRLYLEDVNYDEREENSVISQLININDREEDNHEQINKEWVLVNFAKDI